jgi:hypothetical protein
LGPDDESEPKRDTDKASIMISAAIGISASMRDGAFGVDIFLVFPVLQQSKHLILCLR